jgi:membrane protease YdiL (CAAX protease family)
MKDEDTVILKEKQNEKGWRVFLGSFVLLIVSYLIYFVRYPMWQSFVSVEVINAIEILSSFIILMVALLPLKKDSKKPLSAVFANKGSMMILVGLGFGLLYLGLCYLTTFFLGSRFELGSFPSLRGFESYAVYSIPSAFALYLAFSIFGGFTEEVAYRGYVQTRISSRYGYVAGIIVSTLFFSFQHIHVFQTSWLMQFFQTQFFHVMLFGIFGGYLFFKSKENIWCVFSMHALTNAYSVSVPIIVTDASRFTFYIAEIASFSVMFLLLRHMPLRNKN